VVARDESEHAGLDELLRRAKANGVELEEVDEDEARRIEPCIRTAGRALWSPTTSAVSPREVMTAMAVQASELGIVIRTSTAWCGRAGSTLCMQTTKGDIDAGYVINAAGLFADRVARAFDFGEGYCMLPFRGVYLYGNANAPKLNVHVYPVPDLDMPFLGLHFTVTVDGRVKIGPTAMPTMWREGYGLDFDSLSRFQPRDLWEIATAGTRMLLSDGTFRNHARGEARKLMRGYLVRNAAEMLRGIKVADFDEWGAPGIRAQLYDENKGELVMDFHIEGDDRSMHVLNAVSPAFTCAFAFAEHLVDEVYTRSS
jgi:L-2-hydroxyglutarate oxidase